MLAGLVKKSVKVFKITQCRSFNTVTSMLPQQMKIKWEIFRVRENVSGYVTFQKESNQTVAVYRELFSAPFLPGQNLKKLSCA